MQFSLRALLSFVTLLAVYLAVVFAIPSGVGYVCLMLATVALLPVIVTGVVYDRGFWRTFWIGCAAAGVLPLLIMFVFGSGVIYYDFTSGEELRTHVYIIATGHGLVVLSGCAALATRILIDRKNRRHARRAKPAPDSVLHGRVTVDDLKTSVGEYD